MLGISRSGFYEEISHRRQRGLGPLPAPHEDLVRRQFVADGPDRLWATDITEHPTAGGKVYCCGVLDAYSRMVVGWSIAHHMRAELVVDALQMATCLRRPQAGTILHSDRGSQYTSWVFGHRLREAGPLGSMGRVASGVDNTMVESFWSTCSASCSTPALGAPPTSSPVRSSSGSKLGAVRRRHTSLGMLSPRQFEALFTAAATAA